MFPVVIRSINRAFKEIKSFVANEWEDDYRTAGQQARAWLYKRFHPRCFLRKGTIKNWRGQTAKIS